MRTYDFLDVHKYGLNLRREHVDAADNQHIVRSAAYAFHSDESSSAMRTHFVIECADIARTVTDKRNALLVERGEHEFAVRLVGNGLQGFGVDDFGIEEVFHNV